MTSRRTRVAQRDNLKDMARQEWAEWISRAPWDFMWTLTDPGYPHPEVMWKRARYLERLVNDDLYGRHWDRRGQGIESVTALELQQRGSWHAHMLWRLPDHDARDPVHFSMAHWQKVASDLGGWAPLTPPRDNDDVCGYVTKYVLKDGEFRLSPTYDPSHPRTYSGTLLGGGNPAQREPAADRATT